MDLSALPASLDALVLERLDDGRFVARGAAPRWCAVLASPPPAMGRPFALPDVFEFMSAFLADAEHAWTGGSCGRIDSDFWTEVGTDGEDIHLQAIAVCVGAARTLVIRRDEILYGQQSLVLQRARERRLAHEALTREIETKDILVHAIVHDLAAPLHSILGALSLLSERRPDGESDKLVALALEAAMRQRDLIAEILDVFAAEHGGLAVAETGPCAPDAAAVLADVVAEREPVASRKGVSIRIVGTPGRRPVEAEPSRLFRVMTNLVDNAIRHTAQGGLIEISLEREGAAVVLSVCDDGPGVSPELVPHLFEKLPRGRDRGGTGLGLYFCRITTEAWGGGIGYEPRAPRGARFWVRLRSAAELPAPEEDHVQAAPGG